MNESAKNVDQLIKYYSESPMNRELINFSKYCGDLQFNDIRRLGFELKGILGHYLKKRVFLIFSGSSPISNEQ